MTSAWPHGAESRFFDRTGGCSAEPYHSLNVGHAVGDDIAAVAHNRTLVAAAICVASSRLVFANMRHGAEVAVIDARAPASPEGVDALVTTASDVALAIYTADCVPVAIAHERGVAIAHAGWRGAAGLVAMATATSLATQAHCATRDLSARLGPAIGPCCFVVSEEVAATLIGNQPFAAEHCAKRTGGRIAVDLPQLVAASLVAAGLAEENVAIERTCTACSPRYFSHRRDGPATGRQASVVKLQR